MLKKRKSVNLHSVSIRHVAEAVWENQRLNAGGKAQSGWIRGGRVDKGDRWSDAKMVAADGEPGQVCPELQEVHDICASKKAQTPLAVLSTYWLVTSSAPARW